MAASQKTSVSERVIAALKDIEKGPKGGFAAVPYQGKADRPGVLTIGYGHKILRGESFPNPITETQATNLLVSDLIPIENVVNRVLPGLNQCEFDAVCLLAYNIGIDALLGSTLFRYLSGKPRNDAEIAKQWMRWVYSRSERQDGLVIRRTVELMMFQGKDDSAIAAERARLEALALKGSL